MGDDDFDQRIRIDHYVHLDFGHLKLDPLTVTVLPPPATHAILILTDSQGDTNMPGEITVDTTNETVSLAWVDDKGNRDAPQPTGALVAFTSDNPAVASVDPSSGAITPVAEGTTNIGATIADASGNPVMEPDGVTPFSAPSVAVTVSAGAAVGADLTLSV